MIRIFMVYFLSTLLSSLHSLLEDGVASGLADDDIGPLHHHDADEESCVAGELYDLTLLISLAEKQNMFLFQCCLPSHHHHIRKLQLENSSCYVFHVCSI